MQNQNNVIIYTFQGRKFLFKNGYRCIGAWTISIEPTLLFPDPPPFIDFYTTYKLIGWTIYPPPGFPKTYLAYGKNKEKASIQSGKYNYIISPPL